MAQRPDVDEGIADATLALLRTKGPRSVTIEAAAARSGIAKTTIYRRHSDRRDMLSAALSRVATPEPLAADAQAPDRLRWLIHEAVKTIEVGIGFGGLAAMLTDEDPEFSKIFRRILGRQRAELESVIDAAKADGSFRTDVDGGRSSTPSSGHTSPSAPARGVSRRGGKRGCSTSSGRQCRAKQSSTKSLGLLGAVHARACSRP